MLSISTAYGLSGHINFIWGQAGRGSFDLGLWISDLGLIGWVSELLEP